MARLFFAMLLALWVTEGALVAGQRTAPAPVTPAAPAHILTPRLPAPFTARPFPYRRFQITNDRSFPEVMCVRIASSWKVCKHNYPDPFFVLVKDGRSVGSWPAEIMVGGGSTFEAVTADLDGDHKDELIVADCLGMNTGVEVFWRLAIFPNYQARGFTPPLQFISEQYAAAGTFLQTAGDPLCNLFVTEWQYGVFEPHPKDLKDWDYIGRWYRYQAGLLEPIAGRPFWVRRWSQAWYRVPLSRQTPYAWLTHRAAKTFAEEPLTRWDIKAEVRGELVNVIKSKNPSTDAERLEISLRLSTGETRSYYLYGDDLTDQPDQFGHIGDARTGILFPKDYAPADLKAWLVGKQVRMADYQSLHSAVRRVLWR